MTERWDRVRALRRSRPRSRVVRGSVALLVGLAVWSWLSGEIHVADLFSARRGENLSRFLSRDVVPFPLREAGWSWSGFADWASIILAERGWSATLATLGISVLAIVLAGIAGGILAPFAARTLMTRHPFMMDLVGPDGSAPGQAGLPWRVVSSGVRLGMILLRAIPEYVWAFLLLAMLGPNAWPAVLALAIHNAGILGRLNADAIENLEAAPLRSLRALGANRPQLATSAVFPLTLPRFLLYFFYRFETCVREATVLGMLGVVSLGYWIQEARARQTYDEMLLLVGMGALLVLAADVISMAARAWIRRA